MNEAVKHAINFYTREGYIVLSAKFSEIWDLKCESSTDKAMVQVYTTKERMDRLEESLFSIPEGFHAEVIKFRPGQEDGRAANRIIYPITKHEKDNVPIEG